MKIIFVLILLLLLPFFSFTQDIILEPILVQRSRYSLLLKDHEYFSFGERSAYSFSAPEEAADYSSSVDLKKRSASGIQQDLSLRGSIFEDNTVTLAGIKINDPQTGHFNLELPVTSYDLQRLDIFKNSQTVNYSLKKPESSGGIVKVSFGEHALWEELGSVNFQAAGIKNRLSIEHKSSSGVRQDSDFEIYNFSSHSLFEGETVDAEFLFGSTIRDFGAGNFYTTAFPHQEEHVRQQLYLARGKLKQESFDWSLTPYLRRHTDKFILNRHNPAFSTNQHTTYVYGARNDIDFANNLFISFDLAREKIKSTNIGDYRRLRQGISLGLRQKRLDDFLFEFSGGLDYYGSWDYLDNSHLGLGYFLTEDLKLRFAFDRIWRAPSFTELYYVTASNIGNPSLGIQRSNNYETGIDISPLEGLDISVSTFLRDQSNTIDWVKNTSAAPWQAVNAGDIKAYGADLYAKMSFDRFFESISLGYTYLTLDKTSAYTFSKYVFDYNRHKVIGIAGFTLAGVKAAAVVNFSKPLARPAYVTVDLQLAKQIGAVSLSLEGSNIFNKGYEELIDIGASGRWYKLSLSYSF